MTASAAQFELTKVAKSAGRFDVFLSHSVRDAALSLGLKKVLEADGLSVYVDWIEDADLDRTNVSAATAGERPDTLASASRSTRTVPCRVQSHRW